MDDSVVECVSIDLIISTPINNHNGLSNPHDMTHEPHMTQIKWNKRAENRLPVDLQISSPSTIFGTILSRKSLPGERNRTVRFYLSYAINTTTIIALIKVSHASLTPITSQPVVVDAKDDDDDGNVECDDVGWSNHHHQHRPTLHTWKLDVEQRPNRVLFNVFTPKMILCGEGI